MPRGLKWAPDECGEDLWLMPTVFLVLMALRYFNWAVRCFVEYKPKDEKLETRRAELLTMQRKLKTLESPSDFVAHSKLGRLLIKKEKELTEWEAARASPAADTTALGSLKRMLSSRVNTMGLEVFVSTSLVWYFYGCYALVLPTKWLQPLGRVLELVPGSELQVSGVGTMAWMLVCSRVVARLFAWLHPSSVAAGTGGNMLTRMLGM